MARAKGVVEPARPPPAEVPEGLDGTRGGTEATPGRRVTDAVLLGITVGLHLALLLVIFPNTREDFVLHGNLRLFFHDGGWTLAGAVPYRDFLFEYPPGSLLFMLVPHVFAVGFLRYRTLFFVESAVLDVIIVAALYAIARGARLPPVRPLVLYTLAVVALGPLVIYRIDLAPAALTTLALLAWQRDRPAMAAAALAAGTATKLYPLLLLPPLIMDQWLRGRARRIPVAVLAFAGSLAIFLSPALLAGPEALGHAVRFQAYRHLQVESIWATPVLLLHLVTGFALQVAARGRALVVLGPGDALGGAGTVALALVVLATYWGWWRLRRRPDVRAIALPIGTATLVLSTAILSKVLSPQYLIWVMPLFAVLPLRPRLTLAALAAFYAALPLTQWIYPLHYGELVQLLTPLPVAVLATRNIVLVLSLATLLGAFWRLSSHPPSACG
jgi:Glycosyltransferase family 87